MAFCTEYQDVYDAMTNKPSATNADLQDQLARKLVDRGYWSRFDLLYIFAQESNSDGEALINWIDPGTFDATAVNSPTFTSQEGFTGNGSSSYLNTGYSPSSDADNITLDSVTIGAYTRIDQIGGYFAGSYDTDPGGLMLSGQYAANVMRARLTNNYTATGTVSKGNGLFAATRRGSADWELYSDGVGVGYGINASTGLPDPELDFCGIPDAGHYSDNQLSVGFVMDGITDAEALELDRTFALYMNQIGKSVAGDSLISGDISNYATVTGDLTVGAGTTALAGDITGSSTVTGAIQLELSIAGDVTCSSTLTGGLGVDVSLAGGVSGSSTVTGDLGVGVSLAGDITGAATVTGAIELELSLAGDVSGSATVTGDLTIDGETSLAGDIAGSSTLTGNLSVDVSLAGGITCSSTVAGDLVLDLSLTGDIATQATVVGDLTITSAGVAELAGDIVGSSILSGDLQLELALTGSIQGLSTLTGTLFQEAVINIIDITGDVLSGDIQGVVISKELTINL